MSEKVCYCFNYTKDDIVNDYLLNGKSTILEKVIEEKRNGRCNCSNLNPKGT